MSNVQLIDFHAHVLPGMDHGCKNITECKKQLSLAMSAGVSTVVATPHFYPHQHNVASFISRRTEALDTDTDTNTDTDSGGIDGEDKNDILGPGWTPPQK